MTTTQFKAQLQGYPASFARNLEGECSLRVKNVLPSLPAMGPIIPLTQELMFSRTEPFGWIRGRGILSGFHWIVWCIGYSFFSGNDLCMVLTCLLKLQY